MTKAADYLVGHGCVAALSRCRVDGATPAHGDAIVVRTDLGLEIAEVLCPAAPEWSVHVRPAEYLRIATEKDRENAAVARRLGLDVLAALQVVIEREHTPWLALDADVDLSAGTAHVHIVRWADCSFVPVQEEIHHATGLMIRFVDQSKIDATGHGCSNCGGCSTGGCGSCGDCGSGGCSRDGSRTANDLTQYFAQLREQMRVRLPTLA